ncbi:MAG: nucleoside deaminase [bacterium]
MTDEDRAGMAAALAAARAGIASGQTPFGCAIAFGGQVVATGCNTVWRDGDPTRHAEVNAIGAACRELGQVVLAGATLYATCEPCPMCFSAAHWARVGRIVYGATIADARAAGFNELTIPAERLRAMGGTAVELVGGVRAEECRALFREWREQGQARPY